MFFVEADADLFLQSELNCYCKGFALSCTNSCQDREESVRSWVLRLTTIVLGSAQLLGNVFTEVLLWSLMLCHPSVRTVLQLNHFQLFSPGYHLTFSPMSVGRLQLSLRVADVEHLYYCIMAGGEEAAALTLWCFRCLQASSWNIAAVTQDVISFLVCWPSLPKICHLSWESWQKKTCAHTFSCFSANSAFLCKSSSRI